MSRETGCSGPSALCQLDENLQASTSTFSTLMAANSDTRTAV